MPLEIKELHIRVSVNQPDRQIRPQDLYTSGRSSHEDRQRIVAESVEQVVELLKNKNER